MKRRAAIAGAAAAALVGAFIALDRPTDEPSERSAPKPSASAAQLPEKSGALRPPAPRASTAPAPSRDDGAGTRDLLRDLGAVTAAQGLSRQAFLLSLTQLLTHPGDCAKLVELYRSPGLDPAARRQVVDVLATVGHADAQAALRSIFEDPASARDPELVRRLAVIDEPEPETVDLVGRLYAGASGEERAALAETLGTATGKLYKTGWNEQAAPHLGQLIADARDDSPSTRLAVARALGHADEPESTQTLLQLASDESADVQRAALASMAKRSLGRPDLTALQSMVERGGIGREGEGALIEMLSKPSDHPDLVRGIVDALLRRGGSTPETRARLEALLNRG